MEQALPFLGPWFWWVVAGVLLILELLAPGVFLIWLAIAAAVTGLADLALGMGWEAELLVFAAAAVVSVLIGRAVMKGRKGAGADHPHLNRRQQGYVGRSYMLQNPIVDGRGKLTIEDTVWEIKGPDLPAGARVTVTATDGPLLIVAVG
jgi:hypothetical protein